LLARYDGYVSQVASRLRDACHISPAFDGEVVTDTRNTVDIRIFFNFISSLSTDRTLHTSI
jgi:hypothetical protein